MRRYYDYEKKRIIYIGQQVCSAMWDDRWEKEELMQLISHGQHSLEYELVKAVTKKYLQPGAIILEGGCGLGDKVYLLNQSGYKVVGIDYAAKTVDKLNKYMPDLEIRLGDLRCLPFRDNFFDGYWSFGVIEHSYDGFHDIANEMFRVLKPGGFLFMTVPNVSQLRKLKASLGLYSDFHENSIDKSMFYQYAYSFEEIKDAFNGFGFDLMEKQGWSVYKGVRDEIPGTHILMSLLFRFLGKSTWSLLKDYCNHSLLYVFHKRQYTFEYNAAH